MDVVKVAVSGRTFRTSINLTNFVPKMLAKTQLAIYQSVMVCGNLTKLLTEYAKTSDYSNSMPALAHC